MTELIDRRKGKFEQYKRLRQKARGQARYQEEKGGGEALILDELFITCASCGKEYTKNQIRENLYVCPGCGFHYAMPPERRIQSIVDEGSFKVFKHEFPEIDPLNFKGYVQKKNDLRAKYHARDAILTGVGSIDGRRAVIAVMNSKFLMASMGIELGEIVTLAVEHAEKYKLPLIIFCASGGARMQEGILSLMQMAKTSAAVEHFKNKGGLYITVLTHPTTGGVSASFAGLGDITLAEPKALIGFAGPRVIEQTIGQKLPEGFQRSEYLEQHGFVDQVVPRSQMKATLSKLLKLHQSRDYSIL